MSFSLDALASSCCDDTFTLVPARGDPTCFEVMPAEGESEPLVHGDASRARDAMARIERWVREREDDVPVEQLRALIDEVDEVLVWLVAKRVKVAKELGVIKARRGQEVHDPGREQQVLRHWESRADAEGLDGATVAAVAREVIKLCREAQLPGRPLGPVDVDEGPAELLDRPEGLVVRATDGRVSKVVGACLSLTSRCNERCVICMEDRDPKEAFNLPLEDALRLAGIFAGRVDVINSSASEALLYRHFFEYATFIRDRGSRVGVVTNGLALAREGFLERCVLAGLRQIMISIHTSRPETFGRLTGVPKAFPTFLKALGCLDDHNRRALPGDFIDVIVEVVVTRPLVDEIEELLAFIEEKLPASRPSIRVESMRLLNRAKEHPDLQPSIDELASVMQRVTAQYGLRGRLSTRFVPLCLLPGHEHVASEVGQVLRFEKTLGNAHGHSTDLVEVMRPASAQAQPDWHHVCGACDLAAVCPGVYDIPVPDGSHYPCRPDVQLACVVSRLSPPMSEEDLKEALGELEVRRSLGEGVRLDASAMARLSPLVAKLRAAGAKVRVSAERIEVDARDEQQSSGSIRLIFTAEGADVPHFRKIAGVQITYVGDRTPKLDALLRFATQALGSKLGSKLGYG